MASSNYVPFLLSLLVLISLVAPSTSNPNAKLTHELIKKVCLASANPSCLRTLTHDPQAQTLTLADLTLSYVEKARTIASNTILRIEYLMGETLIREVLFKYRHCWKHYTEAQRDLSRAKQRLKSRNFYVIADLATTVFTRASDCDDEFEDRRFPEPVELDRSNQALRVYGGIIYGLAPELLLP